MSVLCSKLQETHGEHVLQAAQHSVYVLAARHHAAVVSSLLGSPLPFDRYTWCPLACGGGRGSSHLGSTFRGHSHPGVVFTGPSPSAWEPGDPGPGLGRDRLTLMGCAGQSSGLVLWRASTIICEQTPGARPPP